MLPIELRTLRVLNGSLPPRALRLVREWVALHADDLADNWERVQALEPLDGHRLRVEFNDGVVRDVDCSFLLHGTLGEPLRDPEYFRQGRVDEDARTVVWPNGLDPAPELLHGDHEPAQPGTPYTEPTRA